MQYSIFYYLKKAALPKSRPVISRSESPQAVQILLWGLKMLVWGMMLCFVWLKVDQGQLSLGQIKLFAQRLYFRHNGYILVVLCLLMILNWGLEAKKWQLLAAPVASISLGRAVRAVLIGLSLGFITPRSLGDYAGRMMETPCNNRERLVGAIFLNRISQSFSTCLFGVLGLIYLGATTTIDIQFPWACLFPLVLIATLACFLFLGKGRVWMNSLLKRFAGKRLLQLVKIMGEYSNFDIRRLLAYANLRYLVFSFQFVLILKLAEIDLSLLQLAAGVAVVYLLKSLIPTFNFLSDLGVREFSALWVFSAFTLPENQLVLASLLLWCLNILLPTLFGGILILGFRLNRF